MQSGLCASQKVPSCAQEQMSEKVENFRGLKTFIILKGDFRSRRGGGVSQSTAACIDVLRILRWRGRASGRAGGRAVERAKAGGLLVRQAGE